VVVKKVLKVFLKVFLTLFALVLGIGAFAGYHIYRAATLDDHEIKFGVTDSDAVNALLFFEESMKPYQGFSCEPSPALLGRYGLDVKSFLTSNSVAHVQTDEFKTGKKKFVQETRFEKKKLTGSHLAQWGDGEVVSAYEKYEDGWFNESRTMTIDAGDSTVVLVVDNSYKGDDRLYVGKRKNGLITECVDCVWDGSKCTDTVRVDRVDVDPVTGKKVRGYQKSKEYYFETFLTLQDKPFDEILPESTVYIYDDLNRLVKLRMNGKTYHFIHKTRDTVNLDVNIYGTPAVKLAHYQRTRKGNQTVTHIETRRYDRLVTETFEDNHLIKSESILDEFYQQYQAVIRTYDTAGNILTDSSFAEDRMLPGIREGAGSNISYYKYDNNGKILSVEGYGDEYKRLYPIALFPLEPPKSALKVRTEKYEYDSNNRLVSYDEDSYQIQKVSIKHDVADDEVEETYSSCRVPRSIEKIEWNKISDLFSISPDGKYRKQMVCEVADKKLTCKDAYYKWTSRALDRAASDESFWGKCSIYLDYETIKDGHKKAKNRDSLMKETYALVSAPLTKDSMVYLDERMLASEIELDSILCDGCRIVQKRGKRGETYSSFTCKLGIELYEYKAAEKNILNEVSVFYGDPKDVPECLVGFVHTSGIALGMTKRNVGEMKLPFMKGDDEWGYFLDYPVYGGWGDSRNLRLRFTKDKLCNYRATQFVD